MQSIIVEQETDYAYASGSLSDSQSTLDSETDYPAEEESISLFDNQQSEPPTTFNVKTCQLMIKAVFNKDLDINQIIKVLKSSSFGMRQDHLTGLTVSELMEVLCKKLYNNYCYFKDRTDIKNLYLHDII